MTELIEVHLLDLPLELRARAAAHSEALQREFELITREESDTSLVPFRLRQLIEELKGRFAGMAEGPLATMAAARDEGRTEVSVVYHVPPEVGDACTRLLVMLAEADDYCRGGELMTLATPPDQVAFREWFLQEFVRQVKGLGPRSWRSVAPEASDDPVEGAAPEVAPEDDGTEGWSLTSADDGVCIAFEGELDLESAPHLRTLVAQACQEHPSAVELDLTEVSFLDSVGLSVLLTVRLRLESDGVDVRVRSSPAVRRVFDLAGVGELFAH